MNYDDMIIDIWRSVDKAFRKGTSDDDLPVIAAKLQDAFQRQAQVGNSRIADLEKAAYMARRETASDPTNRWCQNATVILDAALAKQQADLRGE